MLALVVTVPVGESELAADALWALGVLAVEEREPAGNPMVELWTSLGDDADTVAHAAAGFPARWRWHLVDVDDAVVTSWREHAVPTWVERDLVVHPAWIDLEVAAGTTAIAIEPASTFGLGDHPTTVLTLRAMREALFPGAVVLDVGCGSGVLAVTACRLGAARAEGIDLNPAAVAVAGANAERNGVGQMVTISTQPLSAVDGEYDVVVANILAPALVELAPDLRRVLAVDGVLVVSGLLVGQTDRVVEALAPLRVVATSERDGWVAVSLRR
jgi:ribosomal protein L11 methyltransferase